MAVTIKDVAQEAGVSIKTVSRVVNGEGNVAEKTRVKVEKAIKDLGYRPNVLARGLVSGRSHLLAVMVPQISDPFYQDFILGAEEVARLQGFRVLLCHTENVAQELIAIGELTANGVEGIVLCGSRLNSEQLQELALRHRVAAVTSHQPEGVSTLRIPAKAGLDTLTSHLIGLGHRQIGYLGPATLYRTELRRVGYEQALEREGVSLDASRIIQRPSQTVEDGYLAAQELVSQMPDTTAVACYNDLMAVGALRAFAEAGYRVPDDIALVGFGDIQLASWVTPALTTMQVPRIDMGKETVQMLFDTLRDESEWAHREVDIKFIVRDSCGASKGQ